MAGRIQFVNSVLGGSINYWLQCFKLPKSVITNLTSITRKFVWNYKPPSWSWDAICKPKKYGGLGIRAFEQIQCVFGIKLLWNLCTSESLWADWMKKLYFRDTPLTHFTPSLLHLGTLKWIA